MDGSEDSLPRYTVRESARAKSVRLKVTVYGRLEVVIPRGFDAGQVAGIVAKRSDWIAEAMRTVADQRRLMSPEVLRPLPERIVLPSVGRHFGVEYHPHGVRLWREDGDRLVIGGGEQRLEHSRRALRSWVASTARSHLLPWLVALSRETGLPFASASVRKQRTLWGSCSSRRTISINCKLLFLPRPLVRYVLIHELCHTRHLNHSSRFWALVEEKEPEYRALDRALRGAWRYVPLWME